MQLANHPMAFHYFLGFPFVFDQDCTNSRFLLFSLRLTVWKITSSLVRLCHFNNFCVWLFFPNVRRKKVEGDKTEHACLLETKERKKKFKEKLSTSSGVILIDFVIDFDLYMIDFLCQKSKAKLLQSTEES